MIQKMSPLFKFENIALFINTWTADYKYSVPDSQNLQFPIAVPEHASTVNMLKDPKLLSNLHESTFIKFFDNSNSEGT